MAEKTELTSLTGKPLILFKYINTYISHFVLNKERRKRERKNQMPLIWHEIFTGTTAFHALTDQTEATLLNICLYTTKWFCLIRFVGNIIAAWFVLCSYHTEVIRMFNVNDGQTQRRTEKYYVLSLKTMWRRAVRKKQNNELKSSVELRGTAESGDISLWVCH